MQQVIRDLSIGRKLMLLLSLPVLLLLWLASSQLMNRLQEVQVAQQVGEAIEVSVAMGELIGALQAERGASGVVINSQGQRFTDRLRQLRQSSDQQLARFQQHRQPEVLQLQQRFSELTALRQQVDSFGISANQSAERYTSLIRALMDFNQQLEAGLTHLAMARQLNLLNQFIEMKERAGRERAILGLAFSRNSFTPELLTRFTNNLGAFNAYEENFLKALAPAQLQRVQAIQQDPSFAEVSRLQQLAFTVPLGEALGVDDGAWFDIASRRINQLTTYERELSAEIAAQAKVLAAQARQSLVMLALVILLALTAVGILTVLIARNIRLAVQEIERVMTALAKRDLTQRSQYQGRDEFGRIALYANNMADELQGVMQEIGSATAQVATAAEESSAVTLQTSKGVQQQQQDTELVATAMHEMSATVRDVASSTAEAAALSEQVQKNAGSGQQKLQQTIALIERLAQQVSGTAQVIEQVKQDSNAISSVLDVIRGIAEQTNLLALNAAIEAARAGEQGRGFAVVADEVRTLAQRTAKSTGEIQRMIEGLQQGSVKASEAMRLSLQQAEEGTSNVNETGRILREVLEGISGINDKNIQIASAAEEQTTVADEINQKVLSISDVAVQTSAGAEQTAVTSRELARLAEQLESLIGRFKLA
ncbi:methyl-accepting chemotaxis sensory transducer [Alishewanella agri BL06]|uniref:Methyl-accepting chemotaxis sensory transducer n=1 Tax=Alishewanella agri BL06 TaxID=1195246 RepID=I9P034_9ALTE|nr:methyl-accepting chemotaxis protein [Alishewanella agri]EIW88084.1 methyl-accepting chemotaxis sensory transducer [Alishewanella agri BL06]